LPMVLERAVVDLVPPLHVQHHDFVLSWCCRVVGSRSGLSIYCGGEGGGGLPQWQNYPDKY
jgi:hypothetical protein